MDEQNGFRAKRACIDHIYALSSVVRARLEGDKETFVCFVDFQKAFDWVHRDMLQYKLIRSGITGKLYKAIKSLYKSPVACVQLNEERTNWFPTAFGVKQGDNLSPTLFSLYVNDLAMEIKQLNLGIQIDDTNVSILLYADDIVLMAENEHALQKMLQIMWEWTQKWRLSINSEKTQITHFRNKGKKQSNFTFQFGQTPLSYTSSYKYLGFIFNETMSFKEGRKALSESAGRALGAVLSKVKVCPDIGFSTFTRLFDSMVGSVLFYGAGVWGYDEAPECNSIQNRAMRYFLGVHKYTAKGAIEGDMGWYYCLTKQRAEMVRLWNRLVQLPEDRLTRKIFNWDRAHRYPWARELSNIFSSVDLNMIFMNNLQCNVHLIKNNLSALLQMQWKANTLTKPKLRNYIQIKDEFITENYVTSNLKRRQRSLCAQLRSGTLPLAVEVGRFRGTPVEERLCLLCDLGIVEDELHFVFHCPLYGELRNILFEKIQQRNPDLFWLSEFDMLRWFFSEEIFVFAKFIERAWLLRQKNLYPV